MAPVRHPAARLVAVLAAVLTLGATAAPAGAAAPAATTPTGRALAAAAPDVDGGNDNLRKQLDEASRGYLDAQNRLKNSTKRQQELAAHLKRLEGDLAARTQTIAEMADVAYRTGRLSQVSALLDSRSPDSFVRRAAGLDALASNQDREVRGLVEARDQETRAKAAIDKEILEQRKQLATMAKRKAQAEGALRLAGTGGPSSGFKGTNTSTAVKPAPRNPDGSYPRESCSVNDPTTDNCITPRTLNALNNAQAAGFKHFVSCFRNGSSGEHPLGRACDFAADTDGFGGVATGASRTYGNNLAAYFVRNADRLGVLYVIWFKQIWLPSSGWEAYQNGNGDPSSDHTNHVHLSVY
jgi:hypothetical protein